jgi:anaerobic magnesium-protoporphyrin IX monomethyl ester cyclase
MNILLINSPRFNKVMATIDWAVELGEISLFPPIGLMYLAAFIKKNSAYSVKIIDAAAEKMTFEELERLIEKEKPDIVGTTTFTYTFFDNLRLARSVKKASPKTLVVFGGPHVSMFPEETLSHQEIDFLIQGDGERSFLKLIDSLALKTGYQDIPGLVYREGGAIKKNAPDVIKDLDSLPFPDFNALDMDKYFSTLGAKKTTGTISTSRGCPFNCAYCQVTDKLYRQRSAKNVVDELEHYCKRGIDDFFFFDDLFNITEKRVMEVCNEILARGLKVRWTFRGRVDQVSDNMLKLARKAGCAAVMFGVEDYTDENLRLINKNITIQQAFTAVRLARKNGVMTSSNWMIGFPHHRSKKDVDALLKCAKKINSNYAQFSILQLMPFCKMFEDCVKEGFLRRESWSDYVRNPTTDFRVELYEKYFSRRELEELFKKCYQGYYLRPIKMLRSLFEIKTFGEFKIKFNAARSVFLRGK